MLLQSGNRRSTQECIRVLAIENDEDDCYFLSRMLDQDASKFYQLETTDILGAALDIMKQREFDCVLLDLGLGESDGIETLELFLQHRLTTPVIVLTGTNHVSLGEQAIKAGAEDFIPKFEASSSLITRSITYAIERHRLLLELQNQAFTDPLTHLPNRAAIYDRLESLVVDAERSALNFGVGMMDLDDFKVVNDTFGHRAGDDLLRQVAARLQKNLRKTDMVARLGGDEFIILVTHYHNTEDFLSVLKKKQFILKQPISIFANEAIHNINLGASIGACEWQSSIGAQRLISLADKAMYASKQNDKRDIVLYSAIAENLHAIR